MIDEKLTYQEYIDLLNSFPAPKEKTAEDSVKAVWEFFHVLSAGKVVHNFPSADLTKDLKKTLFLAERGLNGE